MTPTSFRGSLFWFMYAPSLLVSVGFRLAVGGRPPERSKADLRKRNLLPATALGQTEKNSVRAHIFRFAAKSRHRSTRPACRKRATSGLMQSQASFSRFDGNGEHGSPTADEQTQLQMLISRAGRRCSSRYSRYGVSTPSIHFMNARTRRDRLLRCATTRDTASERRRKSGMISTSAPLSKYRPIPNRGA